MARRQLRTSIRWESVVIALFGTVGGLALGMFFSWALVATAGVTYALPVGGLVVLVLLGALAGVIAAARPARRAARLDVLRAIASE
jgi:putative ABC transport system permease protein